MVEVRSLEKVLEQKKGIGLIDRIKELNNSGVMIWIGHGHQSVLADLLPETPKRSLVFRFNGREFDVLEYLADSPKNKEPIVYAIFKIIVSDDAYTSVMRYALLVENPNYKR